jgi:hypothetical protein
MKSHPQNDLVSLSGSSIPSFFVKAVLITLLFAVAGLATMAKNGQYFPQDSSAHYVSLSTKMNVAHSSIQFVVDDLQQPVTRLFSLQVPMRTEWAVPPAAPLSVNTVCLFDTGQLRAPPAARA